MIEYKEPSIPEADRLWRLRHLPWLANPIARTAYNKVGEAHSAVQKAIKAVNRTHSGQSKEMSEFHYAQDDFKLAMSEFWNAAYAVGKAEAAK